MRFLVSFITFIILSSSSFAQTPGADRFGLGVAIGKFVSITGKYWLKEKQAVDFALASGYYSISIYGDYLWHIPHIFGSSSKFSSQLMGYVGIGAGVSTWNNAAACNKWWCTTVTSSGSVIYMRIPLGLEWYPADPPIGVFFELVPYFAVSPWWGSSIDPTIGIRFYF